tara:strand:- start:75 stop:1880 length:1806 start_codon:yes stop_codon:yes gene_type:complete
MSPNVVEEATGGGSCFEQYQVDCEVECPCVLDGQEPYFYSACLNTDGVELTGGIDSCGSGEKLKTPNGTGSCQPASYEICTVGCPCVLEEGNEYTYGQCIDKVSGQPLTEDKNNCGIGKKLKSPNVIKAQSYGGYCPEPTYVDCEVSCPKLCTAPDELWVPDDGAFCMSGDKKLGVPIDIGGGDTVTLHGQGMQLKKLDGAGLTDSQKDGMNFSACTSPTLKPCEVVPTATSQSDECPIVNFDPGWSYQGGGDGTVYTKASAEALFRGELSNGVLGLLAMPPVSRAAAIDSGAFNTLTGEVYDELMPKGYKIAFKASSERTTEWLRDNGCSVFVLEEASAPRTMEAATWVEEPGDCEDVACGQYQVQDIDHNIKLPAWGGGLSAKPDTEPRDCTTTTLPCCMKGTSHYTESDCNKTTGKITFTHTNECEPGNGGPSSYEVNCTVDCEQTDWETTGTCRRAGSRTDYPYGDQAAFKQEQTRQTITNTKNGGKECGPESQDIDCCYIGESEFSSCTTHWSKWTGFSYNHTQVRQNSCASQGTETGPNWGDNPHTPKSETVSSCNVVVPNKCHDGTNPVEYTTSHGGQEAQSFMCANPLQAVPL